MNRGAWQAAVHGVSRAGYDLVTTPQTVKGFPEEKDSGVRAKLRGALRVYLGWGSPAWARSCVVWHFPGNRGRVPWGHTRDRQEGL